MELHRVRDGKILSENIEIPIDFGIILEEDGIITADLYINSSFNLENFMDFTLEMIKTRSKALCKTDAGLDLEIRGIEFRSIIPYKQLVKVICYDSVLLTKERVQPYRENSQTVTLLHSLVIEGLQMEYCEATTQQRQGRNENIGPRNIQWDLTSIGWLADFSMYALNFYKEYETGDVIVKFNHSKNTKLTYDKFLELKFDFISLLSFVNGAQVKVRRESYGTYFMSENQTALIDVDYSFRKWSNQRHTEYIMLNHIFNRSHNVLNEIMIESFDNFRKWNKQIDLNSIIFYLNGAVQARSLNEQYFILIIAFERLTTLYARVSGAKTITHPLKDDFKTIKEELFNILDRHKSILEPYFERTKSIVGGLNQVQRLSTIDKMHGILTDLKIDVTPEIAALINVVRNEAIHEGHIGEGEESFKMYFY